MIDILIGRVVDSIWSTRKEESLVGLKFMIVELLHQGCTEKKFIVAADIIGAGIGEHVLVTQGSSARKMKSLENKPIDAVIVGIIDEGSISPGLRGD